MKYDVNVTRDGRWWMVEIPAIDGLTQARRISEVEEMARSLIAIELDIAFSRVELGHISISVPGVGDVSAASAEVSILRSRAAEAETSAAKLTRELASALVKANVPLRDAGSILGVSYQRVGQLVNK